MPADPPPSANRSRAAPDGQPAPGILRIRQLGRWRQQLTLGDGRVLLQRPIEPADAEPIQATFALLSPEEVRMRFLHPIKRLGDELAHDLTRRDPAARFALVLAEPLPPGEALIGAVARLAVDDDGKTAEFAILVSRFLAGRGLGRHLMEGLLRWARRRGLQRVHGEVLAVNRRMLALLDSLGFRYEPTPDDPGLLYTWLDLQPAPRARRVRRD